MPKTPWFCTMLAAKPHCKIPATAAQIRAGYAKPGDYKQPRLEEALKILLGEDLEGAHDAMADVLGCVRLADWLEAGGHMPRHESA
jgi:DNA polymerase-3 subunit epsilon